MKNFKLKRDWNECESKSIKDFEKKIRFNLPDDYTEFLLKKNGGHFDAAASFPLNVGHGRTVDEGIETFYGINAKPEFDLSDRFDTYHVNQRRMPDYLIAIGRDQGGNQICMLLNNQMFGSIVFWDHEKEVDFDEPEEAREPLKNCLLIAKTFSAYLETLTLHS